MKKTVVLFAVLVISALLLIGCGNIGNGIIKVDSDSESSSFVYDESKADADSSKTSSEIISESYQSENEKLECFLKTRSGFQLGTNCELKGNIRVHMFFVDDNESSWNKESIEEFTEKQIMLGLDFLENEARRCGRQLNFTTKQYASALNEDYVLNYNGTIKKNDENGSHTMDIVTHVAERLGYSDPVRMYETLFEENDYQEVILLFLVNKDGVSYANKQVNEDADYALLEYSVVFTNYYQKNFDLNEITHAAATVAHEILHIYGARDLYIEDDLYPLLQEIYKNDIMMLDYLNIDEMVIGDYTAYSLGWNNLPPTLER